MGLSRDAVASSIRISLGPETTEAHVDAFSAVFPDVVERIRRVSRASR